MWILAGWPVWLWLRTRGGSKPWRKAAVGGRVSIVICVRNGERYLRQKLTSILECGYRRERMEIWVVSDGSTDATEHIAMEFAAEGVQLIRKEYGGKAKGLNAAFERVTGDYVVVTDVRQTLELGSLAKLLEGFADERVGAISGQLVILDGMTQGEANIGAYWKFESWVRKQLSSRDSMFGVSGAFCAFRRELLRPLPADLLLDDMYLPLYAFFKGYRVVVEEQARVFDSPTGTATEFRRKVRTLAGNYQLLRYYPQLLGWGNRLWLDYISYKMGRLVLPYLMLLLLASSFSLPGAWRWLVVGAQGIGYGLGLADRWIGENNPLKKFSSLGWTFLVMMAAAACAVSIWFVPAKKMWQPTQMVSTGQSEN